MNKRWLVSATTISPRAQRWLSKPTAVSLLHIFDRAINLMDADAEIISVVQPGIGAGPFAIVIDTERPFPDVIASNASVRKMAASLQLGSLLIDIKDAALWHPRPNWDALRRQTAVWQTQLPALQAAIAQQQQRLTAGSPAHFAAAFNEATAAVLQALAQQDKAYLALAVANCAGLGPGLTPAGDDFLLGLLLGLWATRPEAEVVAWARLVGETAVPRTTQLSAAWLKTAALGEAALPWHHLANALLESTEWETAVNTILNTGATSGIAALLGFIAAATTKVKTGKFFESKNCDSPVFPE